MPRRAAARIPLASLYSVRMSHEQAASSPAPWRQARSRRAAAAAGLAALAVAGRHRRDLPALRDPARTAHGKPGHPELLAVHQRRERAQDQGRHLRERRGRRQHAGQRDAHQRPVLHHGHPWQSHPSAQRRAHRGRRQEGHRGPAGPVVPLRAVLPAHPGAPVHLRVLPLPPDVPRRGQHHAGGARRGQVPGEDLRRRAAADEVR